MDAIDIGFYRHQGHLTVNGVFSAAEMDAVVRDIEQWGEAFLADLPPEQRAWYLDGGVKARTVLRKLDNPHAHRPAVQAAGARPTPGRPGRVAARPRRLGLLQPDLLQAAGGRRAEAGAPGQLLLRPDRHRGRGHRLDRARRRDPRERLPLFRRRHQPRPGLSRTSRPKASRSTCSSADGARQAADDAGAGAKRRRELHHGNTFHQSGPNHSAAWRRACALHYVRNDVEFATPALPYDNGLKLRIT